jgi:hypothetical protein
MLRVLTSVTQLPVGICWLLTPDDGRTDGEFRSYLGRPLQWRAYDPLLYDHLSKLLSPTVGRCVENARIWDLIPGASHHEPILGDDAGSRRRYFEQALSSLGSCPLLFFDPDNGIEVPSRPYGAKGSAKYVYWREIEMAYAAGHSLVIYQHFARVNRQAFIAGLAAQLAERLSAPLVDSFSTPHVVFFLVARPEHAGRFARAHAEIQQRWPGQIRPEAHLGVSSEERIASGPDR